MEQTIVLTSFHPLISRNILMSGVLEKLTESHRVVLAVPAHKASYFEEHFSHPRVVVVAIPTELTRHDLFFRKLILSTTPTADLFIKKRAEFYKDRKIFSYLASVVPAILFGRSRWYIQFIRAIDRNTADTSRFSAFFERYKPSLVFSTDVQNEMDIAFLRGAARRGISTVAMVRSWDNLTSKGILREIPDELVVHNSVIKAEAVTYSFVDPSIVSIVGIPHYDRYKKAVERPGDAVKKERDTFCDSWGFDRKKKLILFAPFGDRYIRDNKTDIRILETLSEFDANILVRLPPTDTVNFKGFSTKRTRVQFYESGTAKWKGGKKINEISAADEDALVESLVASDLVVTGQSTIAVDAAAFGKPVVVAAFDHEPRAYWDSVTRYFDYEYYRKLRERTGLRMAKTSEELRNEVQKYLDHPDANREVQKRIIQDQVYAFDGKSSERLVTVVNKIVHGA